MGILKQAHIISRSERALKGGSDDKKRYKSK